MLYYYGFISGFYFNVFINVVLIAGKRFKKILSKLGTRSWGINVVSRLGSNQETKLS